MKAIGWVAVLLAVLVVGIAVITALFVTRTWPFNAPYQFLDPRTWEPVPTNQEWLEPAYNYGPYQISTPSAEVQGIFNGTIAALNSSG